MTVPVARRHRSFRHLGQFRQFLGVRRANGADDEEGADDGDAPEGCSDPLKRCWGIDLASSQLYTEGGWPYHRACGRRRLRGNVFTLEIDPAAGTLDIVTGTGHPVPPSLPPSLPPGWPVQVPRGQPKRHRSVAEHALPRGAASNGFDIDAVMRDVKAQAGATTGGARPNQRQPVAGPARSRGASMGADTADEDLETDTEDDDTETDDEGNRAVGGPPRIRISNTLPKHWPGAEPALFQLVAAHGSDEVMYSGLGLDFDQFQRRQKIA